PEHAARVHVAAHLLEDALRMGRMVNHAERINQVKRFDRYNPIELLRIGRVELDPVSESKDRRSLPGDLERFLRQVDGCYVGAMAGEIHGIGADAATDFKDPLAAPAREIGKRRNV